MIQMILFVFATTLVDIYEDTSYNTKQANLLISLQPPLF